MATSLSPSRAAAVQLNPRWVAFDRAGAPNSALQCYRPGNANISGGYLHLRALVENCSCQSFDISYGPQSYSSAYVSMRTFNFLYGVVEFRAKLGGGAATGCWPVVWLEDAGCQASDPTGTDDSCNGQEIDICEILNSDYTKINQQIHVSSDTHNDQNLQTGYSDPSVNFHTYRLTWSAGSLVWNIDGTDTFTITQAYVPNAAMYLKFMFNVGYLNGSVVNSSLPWEMLVDYVTVTQAGSVVFADNFNY